MISPETPGLRPREVPGYVSVLKREKKLGSWGVAFLHLEMLRFFRVYNTRRPFPPLFDLSTWRPHLSKSSLSWLEIVWHSSRAYSIYIGIR